MEVEGCPDNLLTIVANAMQNAPVNVSTDVAIDVSKNGTTTMTLSGIGLENKVYEQDDSKDERIQAAVAGKINNSVYNPEINAVMQQQRNSTHSTPQIPVVNSGATAPPAPMVRAHLEFNILLHCFSVDSKIISDDIIANTKHFEI